MSNMSELDAEIRGLNAPITATEQADELEIQVMRLERVNADMRDALETASAIVKTARQYFPKSMHNADRFALELSAATIGTAIYKATR